MIIEFELAIAKTMGKLTFITEGGQVFGKGCSCSNFLPSADHEKEREEARENLNKALQEKEQVSSELNTIEKSFAELFKRLEKYKEMVEGYKKVWVNEHFLCNLLFF